MRKTRSPFDILGVSPADDITAIRMAWRAKVRLLHPDRATDKAAATALLAEVNAAFDALQGHVPKLEAKATTERKAPRCHERRQRAELAEATRRKAQAAKRGAMEKAQAAQVKRKTGSGTISGRAAIGYAEARKAIRA
ncbi:MAG: J domain-containing protein [Pseudomonadota bacterium]